MRKKGGCLGLEIGKGDQIFEIKKGLGKGLNSGIGSNIAHWKGAKRGPESTKGERSVPRLAIGAKRGGKVYIGLLAVV